jgi:hypothetical protein
LGFVRAVRPVLSIGWTAATQPGSSERYRNTAGVPGSGYCTTSKIHARASKCVAAVILARGAWTLPWSRNPSLSVPAQVCKIGRSAAHFVAAYYSVACAAVAFKCGSRDSGSARACSASRSLD